MIAWRRVCSGEPDVEIDGDVIWVTLGRDRKHRVEVEVHDDAIELRAIVARRAVIDQHVGVELAVWDRNRSSSLVGFRLDQRRRLVGESWIPGAGLTAEEFLVYLRNLAAACDLFEFQLTGKDRE